MKEITLTQGKFAIVDDDDFEELSKFKWFFDPKGYAKRNVGIGFKKQTTLKMHRVILSLSKEDKSQVDHISGNKLDNRRENLRVCTGSENQHNRNKYKTNTSGYKGVSFFKHNKKWMSKIRINRKDIFLGYFLNPEDAHKAYCNAANLYHKDFANHGVGSVLLTKDLK